MKKITLLFLATFTMACSNDDHSAPVINALDGLELKSDGISCQEPNFCTNKYAVENSTSLKKEVTIKFTFSQYDSYVHSNQLIKSVIVEPNDTALFNITINYYNNVYSKELVSAEVVE